MKSFKQWLKEDWKPLSGIEKSKEFDPRGGEIASQLAYDKTEKPFLHRAVRRAMQTMVKRPDRIKAKQEILPKGQIKKRGIQNNTEGGEDQQKLVSSNQRQIGL